MTIGFIAGSYTMQVAKVDSDNYALGSASDPNNPTTNQVYGAYRVPHIVNVTAPAPTRELATDRGGQRIRGQKDLGVADFGTFTYTLSDYDMTHDTIISGGAVDTSYVTGFTQGAPNFGNAVLPRVCLVFTIGFDDRTDANYGDTKYLNVFYPNCTVAPAQPTGSQAAGVNPNALTYTVTVNTARYFVNGLPFSALSTSYTESETIVHNIVASYQLGLATYVANGSATDFTLPYKPLVSTATGSSGNWITKNGNNSSVSSVNTTSGLVTLGAAGASLDKWTVIYPTSFVATS